MIKKKKNTNKNLLDFISPNWRNLIAKIIAAIITAMTSVGVGYGITEYANAPAETSKVETKDN